NVERLAVLRPQSRHAARTVEELDMRFLNLLCAIGRHIRASRRSQECLQRGRRRSLGLGSARTRTETPDEAQPVRVVLRHERRAELDDRLERQRYPEVGRTADAL